MFAQTNGYSLADIAAATGRNGGDDMWGGNNCWWVIVFIILLCGGWNGGWGGNGNNGTTTREEVAYGFDMNGLENGVRGIQQGLCDGFYAMNTGMLNGFSGVQNALCQGFAGINAGMNQNTNDLMQSINADTIANMQNTNTINNGITGLATQIASCCCDLRQEVQRNFCDLNYNLASQACDTRRAISDSTREIIDFLTQDKIATLQNENQTLKFAASQQAQNAYLVNALNPTAIPAYIVQNPNGCNCNTNTCCNY